jgi:hypothetical protein
MDVSRPYAAVTGNGLEGEVLAVLARTNKPLTGRQVARMARRGSDRGARLALNRLAQQGVVDVMDAPPAVLYTLNRDHIAAPVVLALVDLRGALLERLRRAVVAWERQPVHVSLFGPAAREEGDVTSAIELFVVRSAAVDGEDRVWRAQLDALDHDIRRWTGNDADISEVGEESLARLAADRAAVARSLEADAVTLTGPDARRLFETAAAR